MSDNWVVQNLENALNTWNEKLAEIWQLITQSPENFKGGTIWNVIVDIHGAVQAIGLALLVLFFVVGVMRTCGNFAEVKRPEQALKLFIRFAIAKGAVTYGLELMMALFKIVQGMISTIMNAAGFGSAQQTVLPQEIVTAVEDCGFFESIPLWAVTLIGGLFITVLSFIMIMSVYGRFFKLYIYTAIAPVPLSAFAGEPSQSVGKSFIKSYAAVCLALMLIGGSPGSTAGGLKTTTIAVLLTTAISTFRRRENANLFGRRIDDDVVKNAATISLMYITLCCTGGLIISVSEGLPMLTCLFETASAVGTVGLSLGITPELNLLSRSVLILLMFFGRVGGLTLIFAALSSAQKKVSKLPKEKITVG